MKLNVPYADLFQPKLRPAKSHMRIIWRKYDGIQEIKTKISNFNISDYVGLLERKRLGKLYSGADPDSPSIGQIGSELLLFLRVHCSA